MAVIPPAGPRAKLALLIAILATGWLAVRATPLGGDGASGALFALVATLRQAWWGPVSFIGGYTLAIALGVPAVVPTLIGGAMFGFWWGAVWNTVGANLGATAAFWLARRLGRAGLEVLLGARIGGIDRLARESGFAWVLRLRLIPLVPFSLLNFAAGLSALPWRTYAIATALGILPGTLVYTFSADAILAGSREATHTAFARVAAAGALLVLLSLIPVVAKRSRWLTAHHD